VPASDSAPRPRPGRLTYLSDADKTAIYEGALEIIGSVGMRVLHPEALELLRAAGCSVQEPDLVRIPRELVEQARTTAPASARAASACPPERRSDPRRTCAVASRGSTSIARRRTTRDSGRFGKT